MQQNKDGEPQSFKQFGLFSLTLLLVSSLYSGTFEDFKRNQSESFSKYKDERDNAFNKYLKEEWQAYIVKQGAIIYEEPKPEKLPKTAYKSIEKVGPKVNIKVIKKDPIKTSETVVVISKPKETRQGIIRDIYIDFFGSEYGFNIPPKLKSSNFYPRNQKGISNFFDAAAGSEYEELISEIKKLKKELNLNDWAMYLLINKISAKIYLNYDNASLFTWFVFNKLGYAVKVGLANKHIVLMYYSKKTIYSTPSYDIDKKKFYVLANYSKGGVGRLYSYPQNYPDSNAPIDLSLKTLPNFKYEMKYKDLSFIEDSKKYKIGFNYNQNIIDFMATYPQADYETYFNAPLDEASFRQIATKLKEFIDGKKMSEAINFVLHFVQKSFDYQRDNDQFGREKVMFAQETLYYNKSDCEDRAVLFSYLANVLFDINVVGVKYKDHMSTALYIPMDGDSVRSSSRRFVIADPTYINSNIGQNMPKYRPLKPESFIVVKR